MWLVKGFRFTFLMIFLLQDDLRFFIYFDDGEVEYDADSAEEKNKVHLIYHYII